MQATSADGTSPWSESGTGRAGTLTVSYGDAPYAASEGGNAVQVTVTLSSAAVEAVTIPITVRAAGTTQADDYTVSGLTDGGLSFAENDTSKTFTISANEDEDSADEAVELGFGAPLPLSVSAGATARVALTDYDAAPLAVQFAEPAHTAMEGGAAVAVTVRLNQVALREVRVPIIATAAGTTQPADYTVAGLTVGAVSIAAGEQEQSFTVAANQDADTADETVVLGFGAGLPAGSVATATVNLADDDGGGVNYGAAGYRVAEGDGVAVQVTLQAGGDGRAHHPGHGDGTGEDGGGRLPRERSERRCTELRAG